MRKGSEVLTFGYARVSTTDQNPDLQFDALEKAGYDKLFTDKASGSKADRPQFTQMLDQVREGDVILIWKLDRLGRDLKHLISLMDDLRQRQVGFKVLTGSGAQIDTTTANGRLVFGIFAALAEFESELIRERIADLYEAVAPGDVFLFSSGMAAIAAVHRIFLEQKPDQASVQIEFPYLDSLKVQQQFAEAGAADFSVTETGGVAERSINTWQRSHQL